MTQIADSVDVSEVGAKGAASFFESLAAKQAKANKFEEEIKAEQEEKKREAEAARQRKVRVCVRVYLSVCACACLSCLRAHKHAYSCCMNRTGGL